MMPDTEEKRQTLVEHLTELRVRVIRIVQGFALGFLVCWFFSDKIFAVIRAPVLPFLPQGGLVFTGLTDEFMAHIKLAALGGIVLTTPWWLYQIWSFIGPGLYNKERKFAAAFVGAGSLLFVCGMLFVYFVVYPYCFEFLLNFGGGADKPFITIDQYLSFFFMTTLAFGVVFELPLVMSLLAFMGFVKKETLTSRRRLAIVVLSVVAAVMSPPDVMSMFFMLVPLLALFEVGIFLVGVIERKAAQ